MNSIELAISMELDSKKFYLEKAENAGDSGLKSIFHTLAEEESIHARILKNKADTLSYELIDTYAEIKNIFTEIGSYKNIIKQMPDALDVYNLALHGEQESLKRYQEMLRETGDEKDKKIFEFLIEQEKSHCRVMKQLIEMVGRPPEWTESAELESEKNTEKES